MRLVCIWGENASVGVVTQTIKAARYPCRYMRQKLFYFLFKIGKKIGAEKNIDRNTQTVTELFDCGNSCAVVSATDNIVYSRLCNTADAGHAYTIGITNLNGDLTLVVRTAQNERGTYGDAFSLGALGIKEGDPLQMTLTPFNLFALGMINLSKRRGWK